MNGHGLRGTTKENPRRELMDLGLISRGNSCDGESEHVSGPISFFYIGALVGTPKTIVDTALSALPAKCCARCDHGRPYFEKTILKQMVTCKAGPPSVIAIPTNQGLGIQSKWPVMNEDGECDAFAPKVN
jgi:hypothetical protein